MMTQLVMPADGARIPPLGTGVRPFPASGPDQINPYVRAEFDKSIHTWGIPNNLIRTMAWLPRLALTEVDYANSFIFDEHVYSQLPSPADPSKRVLFPEAGFVDRVTKELVINLVSLLNRSRYSITHHTVIGFGTLSAALGPQQAEQMLLRLVDADGNPSFEHRTDLYSRYHLAVLHLALKLRKDAHAVSDQEFNELRTLCVELAKQQIRDSILKDLPEAADPTYVNAYVNGMLIELTWCTVHFAGLLNQWFTVLKVMDETAVDPDGINFVDVYNSAVPESIKVRNNSLLGPSGWGAP